MICSSCKEISYRIRIIKGRELCGLCGGFSEAGGGRTDGVLSRQRTRDQGAKFEGDTINPWSYSKSEKAFVPNDDFVKMHGSNAHNFYRPEDVQKTHPKLAKKIKEGFTNDKTEVTHMGSELRAQKELLKKI